MSSENRFYKLVIPEKLHSLNQYIEACRKNAYLGAKMKKKDQELVEWYIRSQLRGVRIKRPVRMNYIWYESSRKRDLDNISGYGRKICQDAMVNCRTIINDGWQYVVGFSDEFYVDKKNPRIEIIIEEV